MSELARTPRLTDVAALQLKHLVLTKYAPSIVLLSLSVFLLPRMVPRPEFILPWLTYPTMAAGSVWTTLTAVAAALLVWAGEGPGHRRYHWSLPVPRETHDLLRILMGAVWLLLGIAAFCVVGTMLEPRVLREQWLAHASLYYVGLFVTPLLVYTLAMILVILVERPIFWILVSVILVAGLQTRFIEKHFPELNDLTTSLFSVNSDNSMAVALTGAELSAPWHNGREMKRVYDATVTDVLGSDYGQRGRLAAAAIGYRTQPRLLPPQPVHPLNYRRMTGEAWLRSLLLWYLIALGGLYLALKRRPNV